jgi:hypothetical protein
MTRRAGAGPAGRRPTRRHLATIAFAATSVAAVAVAPAGAQVSRERSGPTTTTSTPTTATTTTTTTPPRPPVAPAPAAAPLPPTGTAAATLASAEAEWILLAQGPEGAIASHADRTFVDPYLASFAVIGLASAARTTGDARFAEAGWREVEWYAASMDPRGFVTDYRVTPTGLVSTGDQDSTDAYSGMFLLAVEAVQGAAPNAARLAALAPKLRLAVAAIRATQRADGLTGAKPSWMVAYLMNEAEAYAGLLAGARLTNALGDRTTARDASAVAARISRAVDKLWNSKTRSYDWAVHPDGARQPTNWAQLYPDAVSQVWAVRYGLVRRDRVSPLLGQFLAQHPNAHDPNTPDLVDGSVRPTGYWPGLAFALRAVDPGAPGRFLAGTRASATATGNAWPYSVQIAGDATVLATGG